MKNFLIIFCFFIVSSSLFSQSNVTYDIEKKITTLEEIHTNAWSKVSKIEGYRIQVISLSGANSKAIVENMQIDFSTKFPEIPAYVTYFEPNFRLRVGDFRTKLEAYHLFHSINALFPGAFIIKDKIEYLPK